ncbi:Uncharacterised protein [Enterobacter hormaechei]|nr:Uncharacterised protein [Enterobacter hormaechei]SAA10579.1 Uncharacterised protein [Enterobacter hormaechei]SAA89129.1 Uncharacterised protein [Enterobacter hormaechei]SAB04360.1 Uncharacterised protein [Enterobacter hormaechei]
MNTTSRMATLITMFVIPAAMADENPHCVAVTDGYNVTTVQCDNGTVTVTSGGNKTAVICNSSLNCREIKL